jgi:hypothetical protein
MTPWPIQRQQDLATLKAQLRSELQRLETLDAVSEAPRSPDTQEEIDALEPKLKAALKELQARKREISKRNQEGGSKSESDDDKE